MQLLRCIWIFHRIYKMLSKSIILSMLKNKTCLLFQLFCSEKLSRTSSNNAVNDFSNHINHWIICLHPIKTSEKKLKVHTYNFFDQTEEKDHSSNAYKIPHKPAS